MRPYPSQDPTVQSVEELSDVSLLVVVAPTTQDRIQSLDQFLGLKRHASPGKRAYPDLAEPAGLAERGASQAVTTDRTAQSLRLGFWVYPLFNLKSRQARPLYSAPPLETL